jgi:hypothetical protein
MERQLAPLLYLLSRATYSSIQHPDHAWRRFRAWVGVNPKSSRKRVAK